MSLSFLCTCTHARPVFFSFRGNWGGLDGARSTLPLSRSLVLFRFRLKRAFILGQLPETSTHRFGNLTSTTTHYLQFLPCQKPNMEVWKRVESTSKWKAEMTTATPRLSENVSLPLARTIRTSVIQRGGGGSPITLFSRRHCAQAHIRTQYLRHFL